jgi:voltage-gated potassium channel
MFPTHRARWAKIQRMPEQHRRLHRLIRQGLIYSLLLAVAILGLGGLGFWLIDPRIVTLSDGLWLAFTTAATVGFGDVVPSTQASRAFAVIVVLLGLAVLSLVTASLSAIFVEKEVEDEERQIEKDLMQEIGHLRQEVADLRREIQARETSRPADPSGGSHLTGR